MALRLHPNPGSSSSAIVGARAGTFWWLFAALSAAIASFMVVRAGTHLSTPVDQFLPVLSLLIVVAAWTVRDHPGGSSTLLALPLYLIAAIVVRDDTVRLASLGMIFAATVAVAISIASRSAAGPGDVAGHSFRPIPYPEPLTREDVSHGLDSRTAMALLLVAAIPLRFLPFERVTAPGAAIVCAGLVALLFALRRDGTHHLIHFSAVLVVAAATPDIPLKLSLFPAHLALLVGLSRRRSIAATIVSLGVAGVCGKWALLQWFVVSLMAWSTRALSGSATPSFSLFPRLIDVKWSQRSQAVAEGLKVHGPLIVSSTFFVHAFFVRPALSLLFVLAALIFALVSDVLPEHSMSASLLALALSMLAFFPWSGTLAATFPLPIPLWSLLLLLTLFFLARFGATLLSIISMVLLLMGYSTVGAAPHAWPVGVTLKPGETFNLTPEARTRTISLIVSGSNIAGLGRNSAVARVEALDRRGDAYRRDISIGDVSDWGAYRRSLFFFTRNPVPSDSLNRVEGYGRSAFLHGTGRVTVRLSLIHI